MKYLRFTCGCVLFFVQACLADPLPPDDRLQFADGLFARDLYELAAQEYSGLIADHSEYGKIDEAHYRLGDCYRHMGKNSLAERQYAGVFKRYPKSKYHLKAGIKRADMFIRDKRYEEGVSLYTLVLKKRPPEPMGSACHFFSGEALMTLGRTNDAQKAYDIVADKFPSSDYHPFALLRLADIAANRGAKPESVIKFYRSAATNNISARAAAEALYQIGRLQFEQKQYEDSSRAFSELAKRYPDDVRTRDSALDSAWSHFNSGFSAKALKVANLALAAEKDAGTASSWLYLKANAERQLKKHDQAIATYGRLIERGGSSTDVYAYEQALCYFAKGEYALVVGAIEGRIANKKIREDALWLLARSSAADGDSDSSVQYYTKLYKDFSSGRFAAQAMFRVAGELQARKDWKASSDMYREVSSKHPAGELAAKALFAEGVCLLNAGKEVEAIAVWKTLFEKHPKDQLVAESILSRTVAEMKLGLLKDANRSIDLFFKHCPKAKNSNEAFFWKGVLASEAGTNEKAAKHFAKAIELGLEGDLQSKARAYGALAIYRSGDLSRAAEALQKLKDGAEARYAGRNVFLWLAEYRVKGPKGREGISAAQKVLHLSTVPVEKQEAFCLLARAHEAQQNAVDAKKAYAEAYRQEGGSLFKAEAALALGTAGLSAKDSETAEKYFQSAARLAEGDDGIGIRARAYMGLGELSEMTKDYPAAARYFMSVAILFDDAEISPTALHAAARCYGLSGKDAEQKEAREELSRRYPKHRLSTEIEKQ